MKISSLVQFADEKIKKAFEKLDKGNKEERELQRWLLRAFEDLRENSFCGIQMPKRLIPKKYIEKYNIKNLWKYNLPNSWRLIYSVENSKIVVVSIILEWLDHKEYERRFGYG